MKIKNEYGIFKYDGKDEYASCSNANGKNSRLLSHISDIDIVDNKGNIYIKDKSLKGVIMSLFTKYYLVVTYKLSYFNDDESKYKLQLNKSDLENALEIVSLFNDYKEREAIRNKEREEKLKKDMETNQIEIIDINGNKKKIWIRECFFKDEVLVTEGSKTYHTHADCYLNWNEMYRRKFKGWKVISLKDAEAQGLTECRLCEKYYEVDD